jgi:ankyrin repeat protein
LFLVDHGADVNAKALLAGHTALHYAAGHGDLPMVLGLLAKGADANAKRQDGVSVLLESACGGFGDYDGERDYVGVIKALLAHGADVNASRAKDGLTPLHGAARAADEASVRLLISSGADVNAKDTNGLTALDYANERANGAGERLLPRIRPIQELLRELR